MKKPGCWMNIGWTQKWVNKKKYNNVIWPYGKNEDHIGKGLYEERMNEFKGRGRLKAMVDRVDEILKGG